MKNNKKMTSGITLIALVVTIIVLLILAGISIMMLTGENGILTRAGEARDLTGEKQIAEKVQLAYLAALTEGKGEATEQLLRDELDKEFGANKYELSEDLTKVIIDEKEYDVGGIVVGEPGKKITKDINGTTIKKTEGVTEPWLPTSKAEILNNDLTTGLTIKDEAGNEWVWVEVPMTGGESGVYKTAGTSITEFTDAEYLKIAQDLRNYSGSTLNNTSLADHLPPVGEGVPDYTSAYKDVLKSIYQNGGFYVGRYETWIQGTENATTSARDYGEDYTGEHLIEQVAVIKENVQPYTWVRWGQAQTLAQGISAGKKGDKTSSLLMGVQWDLVLKFIGKNGDIDSHEWGNYADSQFDIEQGKYAICKDDGTLDTTWTSEDTENYVVNGTKLEFDGTGDNCKGIILTTTGANTTKNSKKNICDIAGNVYEWTIEKNYDSFCPCSYRGGVYRSYRLRRSGF